MKLKFENLSKDLLDTIKESPKKGTSPYDAPAEVVRIDGDTVWVHISGGVEETPAQRTIDCKVGDKVQIRVGNGTAWLVGNVTAPPTDDTVANTAVYNTEILNEYVDTHLSLTDEGLWLIPSDSSNKVLIATGRGNQYKVAGTYMLGSNDETLAKFTSDGMTVTTREGNDVIEIANLGYGLGNAESGTANAPYYTLGRRDSGYPVGNYSVAEGKGSIGISQGNVTYFPTVASGLCSHAEGGGCTASNVGAHAEGQYCTASGHASHAEGSMNFASGAYSHAGGRCNAANGFAQTVIGKFNIAENVETTAGEYVVIIGNGTSNNARSNALTVDWNGNVNIASGAKYKIDGNDLSASDVGIGNYVISQGQYASSTGNWVYRVWSDGFQEVWYKGSVQFTTASSVANGWHRATNNVTIPISSMDGVSAFSDNAVITVSGSYAGRIFTHGGLKADGTQFEAQQLGGASMATATIAGWNVYIAGYARA